MWELSYMYVQQELLPVRIFSQRVPESLPIQEVSSDQASGLMRRVSLQQRFDYEKQNSLA